MESVLSQSASEAGIPVTSVVRQGPGRATLVSNSVRPQAFFAWVDQIETSRGLIVERLSATAKNDQTLSVEVTFRTRGR
jgi:type II secretory pathway component PulM